MTLKKKISRIRDLRGAFRRTFNGPDERPDADGIAVLSELRKFCYGNKPTLKTGSDGHIDPYASIAAAARQEVYQRIIAMLNIDDEDLARMERVVYQEEANGSANEY